MAPASIAWFARHELSLAWRDWFAMMTGGKRRRAIVVFISLAVFSALLHLMAFGLVTPWVEAGIVADKSTLVLITGGGFLFFTVMLSQALESVTRAYYSRADLDLLLSSPASSEKVFAVRTGAIAFGTVALACLLASPVVNILAIEDGAHWLLAFPVLGAMGAFSAALAVVITLGLFRLFGPKRTRLIAQIVAGIVGAGFVIGIQAAAIMAYGNMSRFTLLQSDSFVAASPDIASWIYAPARAALGDLPSLLAVLVIGFAALAVVIALTSSSFQRTAVAAAGVSQTRVRERASNRPFVAATARQALRRKEWKLLRRDPWLLSQTLMQILYLVPPALLLWMNFGADAGIFVVVVPVLVMAAGQLAGGLAWLCISGEDAHDLVVTAPIPPDAILRAKIEAVLAVLAVILLPLVALIAISSWQMALVTALGAALAAGSATAIQLWFRMPMRRALFRRRQVASRTATLSEAFASIMWAGAAALLASGGLFAAVAVAPALLALLVLVIARALSPKRA